ncbi:MAG: hypothetical protein ACXAC7_22755, partial [Candidatus Hodarchaeales archaeon]
MNNRTKITTFYNSNFILISIILFFPLLLTGLILNDLLGNRDYILIFVILTTFYLINLSVIIRTSFKRLIDPSNVEASIVQIIITLLYFLWLILYLYLYVNMLETILRNIWFNEIELVIY